MKRMTLFVLALIFVTATTNLTAGGCTSCQLRPAPRQYPQPLRAMPQRRLKKPRVLQSIERPPQPYRYQIGGESSFQSFVRELNSMGGKAYKQMPASVKPAWLRTSPFDTY